MYAIYKIKCFTAFTGIIFSIFYGLKCILAELHYLPMNKSKTKLLNGLLILVGAAFLACTMFFQRWLLYLQIAGFVFLMLGAYRSSLNRSETLNDTVNEEE